MMIDTHSHLDMIKDTDKAIKDSIKAGVEKIVLPGADPKDFDNIIEIVDEYPKVYGAIGVHPTEAQKFDENMAKKIDLLAHHPKIVAIGEIGLDYYWDKTYKDIQKKVFKTQIEIAISQDLPVLVHDREAHLDTFNILKEYDYKKVIMHCFSGSVESAKECVKLGWLLGIGGVITFKNAKKLKEAVKEIPLEYLVLETDAPYLTPHPFRGEENSPKYLSLIAKEIANIKDTTLENVQRTTTKNAENFFNFHKEDFDT